MGERGLIVPAASPPKALNHSHRSYGAVYASAWEHIKKAIETAGRYGIGVLVGKTKFRCNQLIGRLTSSATLHSRPACCGGWPKSQL